MMGNVKVFQYAYLFILVGFFIFSWLSGAATQYIVV